MWRQVWRGQMEADLAHPVCSCVPPRSFRVLLHPSFLVMHRHVMKSQGVQAGTWRRDRQAQPGLLASGLPGW